MAWERIRKNGIPAKKPGRKPDPAKAKRPPTFVKGVERPHTWVCGPDKEKHDMYLPWMRSKAQANFRQEGWLMSFEEFYEIWKDHWHLRGRQATDYCMSRIDPELPWSKDNAMLIKRLDHLTEQAKKRFGMTYKKVQYTKLKVKK
jgi:hypothetical protein